VELVTNDNVRLVARWWRAETPRASVVLAHGFGASVTEGRVVALAEAIHGSGFDVLAYDARGHGGSGGEATLGDRERLDVEAAVDAAPGDRPVVLVGASMGAIAVLRYAASAPGRVAGVVTVSCPAEWRLPLNARGLLSALLTQTWAGREFARRWMGVRIASRCARPAPPVELIGHVGAPVAVLHGRRDPFIGVRDAELLYAAARAPRRLDLVDDLGHAFDGAVAPPGLSGVDWCLAESVAPAPRRAGGA
jgi:pimeloyl-ACP methyl ester carboxylesterase